MVRKILFLGLCVLATGALLGCLPGNHWDCENGVCEPTQVATQKLCPTETHACMPYVGGGWDNVLRWRGEKASAPKICPKDAAGMSFWGNVIDPAQPSPTEYAVGCGFVEAGTCEGVITNGEDYVCAPVIAGWPACVVANSPRECPPDYNVQTVVGSGEAADMEWTVCCVDPHDSAG